jgi:hypothetical protein
VSIRALCNSIGPSAEAGNNSVNPVSAANNAIHAREDVRLRNFAMCAIRKRLKGMAGTTGLEPAASAVTGQRSNQLNYVPTRQINKMLNRQCL